MIVRRTLPAFFLVLLSLAVHRQLEAGRRAYPNAGAVTAQRSLTQRPSTGTFPDWRAGNDCPEPDFQVHHYSSDLYIIRQSKCRTFEAPFMYLIFGEEKVLLMDTGAVPSTDVYGTVITIVERWLSRHQRDTIDLVVAHTHTHPDHIAGDSQFAGQPYVDQVVGLGLNQVIQFWGFHDFPHDQTEIDLGNRVIDVLGTPGHQIASVSLYDRKTRLLLTGDIVYPGHLFIFSPSHWDDFQESLRRLAAFAAEHPVEWVLGCHIEMSAVPFGSYAWGTPAHPNEHVLQFRPEELIEIRDAAFAMGDTPTCRVFDDFVIHPVYLCGITWNP